jgi:hypothetical protein
MAVQAVPVWYKRTLKLDVVLHAAIHDTRVQDAPNDVINAVVIVAGLLLHQAEGTTVLLLTTKAYHQQQRLSTLLHTGAPAAELWGGTCAVHAMGATADGLLTTRSCSSQPRMKLHVHWSSRSHLAQQWLGCHVIELK